MIENVGPNGGLVYSDYLYKALLVMSDLPVHLYTTSSSRRVESSSDMSAIDSFGHMSKSQLGTKSRLAHISK